MATAKGMKWKDRRKINRLRKCANKRIAGGTPAAKAFYQCACSTLKVHDPKGVERELLKMLRK